MADPGIKIDWEDLAWNHNFQGDYIKMLKDFHHKQCLTVNKIGELLNLAGSTVSRHMKRFGVEVIVRHNPNSGRSPRLPKG